MSKELILSMSMSADGFVSGPNGEVDWIFRNSTEASVEWAVSMLSESSLLAIGHRSYGGMADFWPTSTSPFARPMNEIPKMIFSRSGAVSPPSMEKTTAALEDAKVDPAAMESWLHPQVAGTDLVADIERLKAEDGKPIVAIGGASFATSLIAANLVDVFRLSVHPVFLGHGVPIFAALENPLFLKLEDLKKFDSGV
ncbi:dihydrofolate reductase, partial [bacterium]